MWRSREDVATDGNLGGQNNDNIILVEECNDDSNHVMNALLILYLLSQQLEEHYCSHFPHEKTILYRITVLST